MRLWVTLYSAYSPKANPSTSRATPPAHRRLPFFLLLFCLALRQRFPLLGWLNILMKIESSAGYYTRQHFPPPPPPLRPVVSSGVVAHSVHLFIPSYLYATLVIIETKPPASPWSPRWWQLDSLVKVERVHLWGLVDIHILHQFNRQIKWEGEADAL